MHPLQGLRRSCAACTLRLVARTQCPHVAFDRFYRYAELTELLHAFARELSGLVTIEAIGKSHEGRDIWALTVTNGATGPAERKARVLGRRQHPFDGSRRVGRVALLSCTRSSRSTATMPT